ncbi:MAG TPA: SIR2 family protein [Kiritimatiellia bacterium]|nr:SIR2 family protein [Kiritimatiellia bacterium]HMP00401.1 SIR2 family protein [Kiritimatiellia bacterium]
MGKTFPSHTALATETHLSYEDLAKKAQHFLAERPVVVLGSGATIPHGLPSMPVLAEMLLAAIDDSPPGWADFSARLEQTKDLEQALHDVALPTETVEILVAATWEIVSAKDVEFHDQLLAGAMPFPLADLFRYLLGTADAHLRVVTTNYDRSAEYAANCVGAYVSTGITAGWLQRFVPASVNVERPPAPGYEGQVSVLKVHGSLDWFRDATDDVIGVPLARAIPRNTTPLVVTPGVTKYREVHKDPFRTVMTAADAVLRGASCYVCVGYGFNDEHVQPILVNRVLKSDVPLVLVTKKLTELTRKAFLTNPPKRFLFLEEAEGATMVYDPEYPGGIRVEGTSVWKLDDFMRLIKGEKATY